MVVVQIVRVGGLRLDFDEHEPAMSKLKDNRDRGRPRGPTPPTYMDAPVLQGLRERSADGIEIAAIHPDC